MGNVGCRIFGIDKYSALSLVVPQLYEGIPAINCWCTL